MDKNAKIYVAGHMGLVGSAIVRELESQGYSNILRISHKSLDLMDQAKTNEFFDRERPEYVFLSAAKVGGIHANSNYKGFFIYNNLMIQCNVMEAARRVSVKKLLFLGSSCIYPKHPKIPISEDQLLAGPLEPTNDAYAVAKIAGIMMARSYNKQYGTNFISCMPTNLYGIGDNYHPEDSHVLPAMIRKFHEAKKNNASVTIWGTGKPLREFLYADDLAEACVFLMNNYDDSEIINIGSGQEVSIKELAYTVKDAVGYEGEIVFDYTKPDGTPRKFLDCSKIYSLGWKPRMSLLEGIKNSYRDFLNRGL